MIPLTLSMTQQVEFDFDEGLVSYTHVRRCGSVWQLWHCGPDAGGRVALTGLVALVTTVRH
jgi:hypothetical protein